ncbi:MAG: imidazole glycerol phosphate synthase subunit HisH [Deltaproteobacteria bacterium]|nr:imidazole glycerol phosphate synthase subunit HisH [Deltaproteobacteria bacterium]
MIGIVDYRAGNITSVVRAFNFLGIPNFVSSAPAELAGADRIVFPGVGAAGEAMANIREQGLDIFLRNAFVRGVPILGICLGTQIIFEHSQEDGGTECLKLVKGTVKLFPHDMVANGEKLKVPHMGWNGLRLRQQHPVFANIDANMEFYFVHSYYPSPKEEENILGTTEYGIEFCSAIATNSLVALQFHPEKSGRAGLAILRNFASWLPGEN